MENYVFIKSELSLILYYNIFLSFCDRLDFLMILCVCQIQEINLKKVSAPAD